MASNYYLGNKKLKNTDVEIEWNAEKGRELKRCARDPIYFIKMYCKIVHVDDGLVNFNLWPFQEEMIDAFDENRFVICKLLRQCGKTTTTAAYLLHCVLFKEHYKIAILANKERQAREILSRIQGMFEHLPDWMQQGVVEWNKGNIELENGSKIVATSTSSTAIRGDSFGLIYLDEFAFVPANLQEDFFASVYPTISSGKKTKVIITSTPNGMNMFYKIWTDAEQGRNSYKTFSVHWSDVPGRDESWKEETIKNTSERQFRQEFETEFLGSSNTLIDGAFLAQIPYINPIQTSKDITIYKNPEKNHVYLCSVDTSRGAGIDFSAFIIFDITTTPYEVVAKYKNNEIPTLLYPNIIYSMCKHYNDAYALVETNDVGQQVADILYHDMEYEFVLTSKSKGRSGQRVGEYGGAQLSLGLRTTQQVKRIGCANFKDLVESQKFIVNDYDLLYEMCRFIAHNNKYQAEEGEHDDLVMCCVLFAYLVNQPYFKELCDHDARISVLKHNADTIEEHLSPFGFIEDHTTSAYNSVIIENPQNYHNNYHMHGNYGRDSFDDEFDRWMRMG
jgi:hypothetical protein